MLFYDAGLDSGSDTDDSSVGDAGPSSHKNRLDAVTQLLQKVDLGNGQDPGKDESEEFDERSARTARSPLLWFVTGSEAPATITMEQTQLGVYRGLFPDPTEVEGDTGGEGWHARTLARIQPGRLHRRGGVSGWAGKRLRGAEEPAGSMGMAVLDGRGFLPGLSFNEGDSEDGSDSDSADAHSDTAADPQGKQAPNAEPPLRMWTLVLFGGGHFAAMVVALNPRVIAGSRKKKGSTEERAIIVLAHKTFHRYTTRRKQGGGQSAQDASGKFAKSAGAQLRRAGEAALGDEVRALLGSSGWRTLVERSERVWFRASPRAAKGILWNWDGRGVGSPLDAPKEDGRMLSLPFPTRRPTLGELVRCFFELTRVKVAHATEEELRAQDEAYRASLSGGPAAARQAQARAAAAAQPAKPVQPARAKISEDEKARRERFRRLVAMVRKGRMEALVSFLARHESELLPPGGWDSADAQKATENGVASSVDAPLPAWWRAEEEGALVPGTLLQLAAAAGQEEAVRYLLIERRADPTLPVPLPADKSVRAEGVEEGKPADGEVDAKANSGESTETTHRTAYDLASTREVRTVFRRLMAEQPDWADWGGMGPGGARIPSALTDEMENAQRFKAKDRRRGLREKARERERERAARSLAPSEVPTEPEPESTPAPASAPSSSSRNRLGGMGAAPRALLEARDEAAGLTPEMRARIEREKRARAAEARMKALEGGGV